MDTGLNEDVNILKNGEHLEYKSPEVKEDKSQEKDVKGTSKEDNFGEKHVKIISKEDNSGEKNVKKMSI